jgi:TPR repeat protein
LGQLELMHSSSLNKLGRLLLLVVLWTSAAMAGDFQKGLKAFNNEDYATALTEWMPMAEDGDLNAMFNIGLMYDEGLGVPVDKARALEWYLPSAQEGDVTAQFNVATWSGRTGRQ